MLRGSAWATAIGLPAVVLLAGCTGEITTESEDLTPVVATSLDGVFDRVGAEMGVPGELLEAIGFVETRWQMVVGEEEHEGLARAVGIMAIREDDLARAAALASVDEQDIAMDPESNVRAGAALLLAAADQVGLAAADRGDLGAWAPAVAEYSRIADEDSRAGYVISGVYRTLRDGVTEVAENGEIVASLPAHPDLVPDYEYTGVQYAAGADYSGAVWKPSPNYSSRPSGTAGAIKMVIIHTCEGGYAGCVGWLRNTAAGVSAHYVVKEDGGEVAQLVREASKGWHIAAAYQCSRNASTECGRNGASSNNFTIGIEHGGFGSQASWPNGQIEASAKLVCDITRRNNIPRDRQHIVGHGQLQPYNRSDPGPNWPWSHYIDRIRTLCGSGGGGGGTTPFTPIIIDSNNANNNAATGRIELTGTWNSANATAGYYGSGYWWADTSTASAPATFWFYTATAGARTIDAWWTAGGNRSTSALFVARNAGDTEVGRVTKNQQGTGSQWVTLGTWTFSAGWNKVALSRNAAAGKVVIADAIRVR